MSIIDDIIVNAKSAATTVGEKAGQIKEYTKLKYSEAGIKSDINKKKQELGDYVYRCTKSGNVDNEILQKMVDDVTELEENLQITKEMITAAKNKVVCSACKAENEKDAVYCSKCGEKLTEEKEEKTETEAQQENSDECEDVTVAAASSVDDVTCEAVSESDTEADKADDADDVQDEEAAESDSTDKEE